ncbi:MAG: division/cell wall cluster transcriptional repressor MraZ [Treponema sp.]|nr:division/cell wall cluster transcriptional repressor MraZ [Treponema sp.]
MLRGEYQATLDEKGRISIPARLREGIPDNALILTKGMFESCIWAFTPENHEKVTESLRSFWSANANMPMTPRQKDMFDHRLSFSTSEAEIDKTGRIMVPQKFRDHGGLSKDCVILGAGIRIEIWDAVRYTEYEQRQEEQLEAVLEKMGPFNLC